MGNNDVKRDVRSMLRMWEENLNHKRVAMERARKEGDFVKAERLKIQISAIEDCFEEVQGVL